MKYATGADDPSLKEATWPLPEDGDETLLGTAQIVAAYRSLLADSTTAVQQRRLAALRRAFKRSR